MPLSLLIFSYLQVLDLMSTVAFLMLGVQESNPLIRWMISLVSNPIGGLLLAKGVAILLGVHCWLKGRGRVLFCANLVFALVVAWNLAMVIVKAAQIG